MLKISYPNIGEYERVVYRFLEKIINKDTCEILRPSLNSNETVLLGEKSSPSYVCSPFKYTLGTMIDSLNKGANVIIQIGGGCRFGYYAEVQEKILKKDLGHEFIFINLYNGNKLDIKNAYDKLKILNPKITIRKVLLELNYTMNLLKQIDNMQSYVRDRISDLEDRKSGKKIENIYYDKLLNSKNVKEIHIVYKEFIKKFNNLITNNKNKLKIGIVGELYSLMDPFASSFLENELIEKGYKIKRYTTASYLLFDKKKEEIELLKKSQKYIKYRLGADGTESVAHTLELIEEGYDGVIHIKPFGCTPEINAMPILKKISQDHSFPIMFYTFDSLNSRVGMETRIEAFIDMLEMRKENEILCWS